MVSIRKFRIIVLALNQSNTEVTILFEIPNISTALVNNAEHICSLTNLRFVQCVDIVPILVILL